MREQRILFTAFPAYGHLLPMLPLIRAAGRAGHDVRVATGPDLVAPMRARGLAACSAGASYAQIAAARDELTDGLGDAEEVRGLVSAQALFGHPVRTRLAHLQVLAGGWSPDLVVHDPLELAGPMLAHRRGVPSVTHGYGPMFAEYAALGPAVCAAAGDPDLWEAIRNEPYLDVTPPSLQPAVPPAWPQRWPVRPTAGEGDTGRPDLLDGRLDPERPWVYLTLGTLYHRGPGEMAVAVEAVAGLPVDLVVTTGPGTDPRALGPQPPHVVVADFVPQAMLLRRASLLVSQCGAGTMLGALCHGVPQVCLPRGADQGLNAAAVERAGAGVVVAPEDFSAPAIRTAVRRVLTDPTYGAAARRVRGEIDSMWTAEDVLPALLEATAGSILGGARAGVGGVELGSAVGW